MDGNRFDTISRSLTTVGTRRAIARLLGALPLVGVLMTVDEEEPAGARRRGKAQRQRADKPERLHEQKKKKKRKRKKKHKGTTPPPDPGCTPEPVAETCAGRCGTQRNNCDTVVNCDPCTCATECPVCQSCDTTIGQCVADPSKNRDVCAGSAGAASVCCNGACCNGCCGEGGVCTACLAFVTSTEHNGNLGGLNGADDICRARAEDGDLPGAAVPGNYKAWLSDTTGSPSTRFRCTQVSCSSQGYKRVDDEPIASDWSMLTDGSLEHAISVTETNGTVLDNGAWTHTTIAGTKESRGNSNCSDWSVTSGLGNFGEVLAKDSDWTAPGVSVSCAAPFFLYCFQQS